MSSLLGRWTPLSQSRRHGDLRDCTGLDRGLLLVSYYSKFNQKRHGHVSLLHVTDSRPCSGILVNTSSAGLFLYIKGHGSTIFRDGLRLALILFLASSALWAQVEFLSTLIDSNASSTCQAAVVISSLFDQLARVSIEQFLIWAIAKDGRKSAAGLATQVLLLARFVVGMVFVGVTKPQFNSTCVPLSSIEPVAITTIALDAVILTAIAALALSARSGKTVLLILASLATWMGVSDAIYFIL